MSICFLANRKMFDGIVVVNETLDFDKRHKKWCFLVKVEFEKTYENVAGDYLRCDEKNGIWFRLDEMDASSNLL